MSTTPTAARPTIERNGHWYDTNGVPCFRVPRANGVGDRATTLADARKLNLLPSTTNILRILEKPALTAWKIEQAALALITSPRNPGEADDAFVQRIIHEEKQQDQESQIARDKGTAIHEAMAKLFTGQECDPELLPWINPAFTAVASYGQVAFTERAVVGQGYAGTADLGQNCTHEWRLWDFKTTKNLPKNGAYPEHRLQLASYAEPLARLLAQAGDNKPIIVGNVYISTVEPGAFVICEHEDWPATYQWGWAPLVIHWQWANNYIPEQIRTIAA